MRSLIKEMLDNYDFLSEEELIVLEKMEAEEALNDWDKDVLEVYRLKMHIPGVPGKKEFEDDDEKEFPKPKPLTIPLPKPITVPQPAKVPQTIGIGRHRK